MNQFNKTLGNTNNLNDYSTDNATITNLTSTNGTITTLSSSGITSSGNINISNTSDSYQIGGKSLLSYTSQGSNIYSTFTNLICSGQALIGDPWGQNQILLQQDTTTNSACITGFQEGVGAAALQVGLTGFPANLYLLNGSLTMGSSASTIIDTSANATFNSISLSSNTGSSFGFMYISSSSATTISSINTWYLVAGTTSGYGRNTTISTTNRITLNGTKPQYYKIDYNASFNMTTGTTDTISFSIYIDVS